MERGNKRHSTKRCVPELGDKQVQFSRVPPLDMMTLSFDRCGPFSLPTHRPLSPSTPLLFPKKKSKTKKKMMMMTKGKREARFSTSGTGQERRGEK